MDTLELTQIYNMSIPIEYDITFRGRLEHAIGLAYPITERVVVYHNDEEDKNRWKDPDNYKAREPFLKAIFAKRKHGTNERKYQLNNIISIKEVDEL
jgi:hypothetical protein